MILKDVEMWPTGLLYHVSPLSIAGIKCTELKKEQVSSAHTLGHLKFKLGCSMCLASGDCSVVDGFIMAYVGKCPCALALSVGPVLFLSQQPTFLGTNSLLEAGTSHPQEHHPQ